MDHPDQAAEFGYDLRNLVKTVTVTDTAGAITGDPKTTSYTYDERGSQVTQTKGNGNVVTNAYFNDGALKTMREETPTGALVASHEYTYNENGSAATDSASKRNADTEALMESVSSYTYDPVDRLIEKVKTGNGASTETYVHDDNANVVDQTVGGTTTTYRYDRNRLQSATIAGQTGSASYTYDPFGRQASVVADGRVISRSTYDGFDHVIKSEQANDTGVLETTTYAFDPLDRTVSKVDGDGVTTRFTYLGLSSEVLTEDVAGQLAKSYQYSPWGQRLSQVTHPGAPDESDGDGAPEVGTTFYGYNAHTDVETLTDETGGTVATYGYTAYGKTDESETTGIDKPNPASPDAEPFNAYRYNSKRFDASSGTYDMGFRNYDPGLNRFTSRDMYNGALADLGLGSDPYTSNRYAFGAGNPISMIEVDGHEPRPWHEEGVGFSDLSIARDENGDALREADGAPVVASEYGGTLEVTEGEAYAEECADVAPLYTGTWVSGTTACGLAGAAMDDPHLTLQVVGGVPLVGEPVDLVDCAWYSLEGNDEDAVMSCGAAVPFLGSGVLVARLGKTAGSAMTRDTVLSSFRRLPEGDNPKTVRTVGSLDELQDVFTSWAVGAERIGSRGPTIPEVYRLPDGTELQWRLTSLSGGETIDIIPTSGQRRRVHLD